MAGIKLNRIDKLIITLSPNLIDWFFKFKLKKKQTQFTGTKFNTVHTGLITHQRNNFDWISSTVISILRYKSDAEYIIDKYSWSIKFEEISLDYDDKLFKLIL